MSSASTSSTEASNRDSVASSTARAGSPRKNLMCRAALYPTTKGDVKPAITLSEGSKFLRSLFRASISIDTNTRRGNERPPTPLRRLPAIKLASMATFTALIRAKAMMSAFSRPVIPGTTRSGADANASAAEPFSVDAIGRMRAKHCRSVVFPTPLSPRINVHCAGLPDLSRRSRTWPSANDLTFVRVSCAK